MNITYRQAQQWANHHRPHVEQRARSAHGAYLVNLTHEWVRFLSKLLLKKHSIEKPD